MAFVLHFLRGISCPVVRAPCPRRRATAHPHRTYSLDKVYLLAARSLNLGRGRDLLGAHVRKSNAAEKGSEDAHGELANVVRLVDGAPSS